MASAILYEDSYTHVICTTHLVDVTCNRYRDLGISESLLQILLEQSNSDGLKLRDSLFVAKDCDISVDLKS